MNRALSICALALAAWLLASPALAQEAPKKAEAPKPAPSPSEAILQRWNDTGRKLIAIAEDVPEDKYDYKPNPDSRSLVAQLLHASASVCFFTASAQRRKAAAAAGPQTDEVNSHH